MLSCIFLCVYFLCGVEERYLGRLITSRRRFDSGPRNKQRKRLVSCQSFSLLWLRGCRNRTAGRSFRRGSVGFELSRARGDSGQRGASSYPKGCNTRWRIAPEGVFGRQPACLPVGREPVPFPVKVDTVLAPCSPENPRISMRGFSAV